MFLSLDHPSTTKPHRRPFAPTILHASSQHLSQVGQSHSILPSAPRGWVLPHRQRIGAPTGILQSRLSIACRCPTSGNQAKGRDPCSFAAYMGGIPPSLCSSVDGTQDRDECHQGHPGFPEPTTVGRTHAQGRTRENQLGIAAPLVASYVPALGPGSPPCLDRRTQPTPTRGDM